MSAKILVVEDEPLIRIGLASFLEEAGYETLEAPNADRAMKLLEEGADVSVVISDVDMPGSMDGVGLAHRVKRDWPGIGFIVMSGKVNLSELVLPENTPFFSKPYIEAKLLRAVSSML